MGYTVANSMYNFIVKKYSCKYTRLVDISLFKTCFFIKNIV